MQSKIIVTADNSKTLLIPELNETYHSTNGAYTESNHIFIKEGLLHSNKKQLNVFEMGFGTGLNALLSLNFANAKNSNINYDCIEAYPVTLEQAKSMNHPNTSKLKKYSPEFILMHQCPAQKKIVLSKNFNFYKVIAKIQDFKMESEHYDIIFQDAFGPNIQEELWSLALMQKFYIALKTGGFLVTYCAQGAFKRNLKAAGFHLEGIDGPPGKREITRATKK